MYTRQGAGQCPQVALQAIMKMYDSYTVISLNILSISSTVGTGRWKMTLAIEWILTDSRLTIFLWPSSQYHNIDFTNLRVEIF